MSLCVLFAATDASGRVNPGHRLLPNYPFPLVPCTWPRPLRFLIIILATTSREEKRGVEEHLVVLMLLIFGLRSIVLRWGSCVRRRSDNLSRLTSFWSGMKERVLYNLLRKANLIRFRFLLLPKLHNVHLNVRHVCSPRKHIG